MHPIYHPTLRPTPSPVYTPEDVIKIQLRALQHNDDPVGDNGIAVVFTFASPVNQEATGPLIHFAYMIHNPVYEPMLNFQRAEYKPIVIEGDTARQIVRLITEDEETAVFVFSLSLQWQAPYSGCWMTDSVIRIE